jgi:hypothetical protein
MYVSLAHAHILSLSHTHAKEENCKQLLADLLRQRENDGDGHIEGYTSVDVLWNDLKDCLDDASMENVMKMLTMSGARKCFTDNEGIKKFALEDIRLYNSTEESDFVDAGDGGMPKPRRGNRFKEGVKRVVYLHMFSRSKKDWNEIAECSSTDQLIRNIITTRLDGCKEMGLGEMIGISYVGQTARTASVRLWEHLAWWATLKTGGLNTMPSVFGQMCKVMGGTPTHSKVLLRVKQDGISDEDAIRFCNLAEALVGDIAGVAICTGKFLNRSQCGYRVYGADNNYTRATCDFLAEKN